MDGARRIALVETKTQGGDDSPVEVIRYQLGNHLGSASLELDDRSNAISLEEYYPFGNTSYQSIGGLITATAKRYRYTGQERDEESGLNHHLARYYATWLSIWVGCDPIGVQDGPNLYAYCKGNPIAFSDTKGQERSIASINRVLDQNGDKKISLKEFSVGIGCMNMSATEWATSVKSDSGGYKFDADVGKIIFYLTIPSATPVQSDFGREYSATHNYGLNSSGNRTPTPAEARTISDALRHPSRKIKSDGVQFINLSAQVLFPEYYFPGRSIFHSITGHPGKAAVDLGIAVLFRFLKGPSSNSGASQAMDRPSTELYRLGKNVPPIERTFEHGLNPHQYITDVAKRYGINLRGSGQDISIILDESLAPGVLGVTREAELGRIIRIGRDALSDDATLANTIAHEVSHARDYLKGVFHKAHGSAESIGDGSVYGAGNALEDWILGRR